MFRYTSITQRNHLSNKNLRPDYQSGLFTLSMKKNWLKIIKEIAGFIGGAIAVGSGLFAAGEAHQASNEMKEFVKRTAIHADSLATVHDRKIDRVNDSLTKLSLNTRKIWGAFEQHVISTQRDKQEIIDMLNYKPDFSRDEKKNFLPIQYYSLNKVSNGQ